MKQYLSIAVGFAGILLVGCNDAPAPAGAPNVNTTESKSAVAVDPPTPSTESTAETANEVPVEIKSWEEVQQWVADQQGKVVVIDVWSTFCIACMQEFPEFIKLHEKYGDRVACASLSIDFYGGEGNKPEDVRPQVVKFLSSRNATMTNFISSDPDETVLKQIDTAAIPASLVYDQQGELRKVLNNDENEFGPEGFHYNDDVVPLVEQLLQSSP